MNITMRRGVGLLISVNPAASQLASLAGTISRPVGMARRGYARSPFP